MAKAPRPGSTRTSQQVADAKRVLAIRLAWEPDEVYRLAAGNLPLEHRTAVRKGTGLPFEAFAAGPDSIGIDSIAVFVWLAKRMHGTPSLSWQQFTRSWPDEIGEGDVEVWPEDSSGRRLDTDGNVLDVAEAGEGTSDPES